jgi:hypothetical protein
MFLGQSEVAKTLPQFITKIAASFGHVNVVLFRAGGNAQATSG